MPSSIVRSQALCTCSATSGWSMCTSISTAPSSSPEGFARFCPARRGAEPWIASNIAHCSPMFADPASPTEPAICAATSDRMSPYRFGITITSNASGVSAIFAAPISTIQASFSISGYSARDLVEDLVEQAVGHLHDVVLHEAGDLLAVVQARVFERVAHDLLAARPRDQLDARHHFRRQLILDARVQILFVLAHDHHVHIGMLGVDERMVGHARPHVGILAQRLARGDVQALEAAALRRGDRAPSGTPWCGSSESQELGSMPAVLPRR